MIYHITARSAWERATTQYRTDSLSTEGFIHFSTAAQVLATADRFYRGQADLVVLCVDPDMLGVGLRYEAAVDGEGVFPHLYGPLDVTAVQEVLALDVLPKHLERPQDVPKEGG